MFQLEVEVQRYKPIDAEPVLQGTDWIAVFSSRRDHGLLLDQT